MAKVQELTDKDGNPSGWMVHCPACGWGHLFDSRWTYNGDPEKPTFSPSMLVHAIEDYKGRCHSYVRDGVWQYLDDCEHAMKGQHVPVPEFTWGD